MATAYTPELRTIAEKWYETFSIAQQSLLISKYPMTNGNSFVEHVILIYLFENEDKE